MRWGKYVSILEAIELPDKEHYLPLGKIYRRLQIGTCEEKQQHSRAEANNNGCFTCRYLFPYRDKVSMWISRMGWGVMGYGKSHISLTCFKHTAALQRRSASACLCRLISWIK